jgi:hypothetical protein
MAGLNGLMSNYLVCDGFTSREEPGHFDLAFGRSLWPDASIVVESVGGNPVDAQCSD